MTTKSRLALLTTLAATPAFAAPFLAIGDNAELYLTARTEARYEDNITYSPDSLVAPNAPKREDLVLEFVPGAQLLFGKNSLTSGSVNFFERFVEYTDHDEYSDQLANLLADATYEGAKVKIVADGSFRELNQASRDERATDDLVRRDVTTGGVGGEFAATEKSKIGVAARYSSTVYKNSAGSGTFYDRDVYIVPVNYYFAITPKVDLSTGVQYRTDIIDVASDTEQMYYNVGARGEFTAKLTGSFSVGYNTLNMDVGDDDSGLGLMAGLAYQYTPKTQFTLNLSNDFDSGSTGGGQKHSKVALGMRSAIRGGVSANVGLSYERIDYPANLAIDRKDDYVTGTVGLVYTVNQYMSVDTYYTYLNNASNDKGAEFEANVLSVAANFRY